MERALADGETVLAFARKAHGAAADLALNLSKAAEFLRKAASEKVRNEARSLRQDAKDLKDKTDGFEIYANRLDDALKAARSERERSEPNSARVIEKCSEVLYCVELWQQQLSELIEFLHKIDPTVAKVEDLVKSSETNPEVKRTKLLRFVCGFLDAVLKHIPFLKGTGKQLEKYTARRQEKMEDKKKFRAEAVSRTEDMGDDLKRLTDKCYAREQEMQAIAIKMQEELDQLNASRNLEESDSVDGDYQYNW